MNARLVTLGILLVGSGIAVAQNQADEQKMEIAANLATIIAAFIAAIALIFGSWQFYITQKLTRRNLTYQDEMLRNEKETKAIDLFVLFNNIKAETIENGIESDEMILFWRNNALLAITESIHNLTKGDSNWEETVYWMLRFQKSHLKSFDLKEDTYSRSFVELIKRVKLE